MHLCTIALCIPLCWTQDEQIICTGIDNTTTCIIFKIANSLTNVLLFKLGAMNFNTYMVQAIEHDPFKPHVHVNVTGAHSRS